MSRVRERTIGTGRSAGPPTRIKVPRLRYGGRIVAAGGPVSTSAASAPTPRNVVQMDGSRGGPAGRPLPKASMAPTLSDPHPLALDSRGDVKGQDARNLPNNMRAKARARCKERTRAFSGHWTTTTRASPHRRIVELSFFLARAQEVPQRLSTTTSTGGTLSRGRWYDIIIVADQRTRRIAETERPRPCIDRCPAPLTPATSRTSPP